VLALLLAIVIPERRRLAQRVELPAAASDEVSLREVSR